MIAADRVRQLLHYDRSSGSLTWAAPNARCLRPGDKAGYDNGNGYRRLRIDGRPYYAHNIAWLHAFGIWPERRIDHVNGDRSDNRLDNLRLASASENAANARLSRANTSGHRGVSWHKAAGRWNAKIVRNGTTIHLGLFDRLEDAARAYRRAAHAIYGDFARSGYAEAAE